MGNTPPQYAAVQGAGAPRAPIKSVNWREDFDAAKALVGFGTLTQETPELNPCPQDVLRHTGIACYYREWAIPVVAGAIARRAACPAAGRASK